MGGHRQGHAAVGLDHGLYDTTPIDLRSDPPGRRHGPGDRARRHRSSLRSSPWRGLFGPVQRTLPLAGQRRRARDVRTGSVRNDAGDAGGVEAPPSPQFRVENLGPAVQRFGTIGIISSRHQRPGTDGRLGPFSLPPSLLNPPIPMPGSSDSRARRRRALARALAPGIRCAIPLAARSRDGGGGSAQPRPSAAHRQRVRRGSSPCS
jgi:hypothetical protein